MKYAVLSVAGAIGTGFSLIAVAMDRNSPGNFYSVVCFLIMVAGAGMVIRSGVLELMEEKKPNGPSAGGADPADREVGQ